MGKEYGHGLNVWFEAECILPGGLVAAAELSLALDVLVSSSGGAAIYEISNCAADHIAEIGVAKRSFVKLRVLEQLRLTHRCDLDCPETGGTSVL